MKDCKRCQWSHPKDKCYRFQVWVNEGAFMHDPWLSEIDAEGMTVHDWRAEPENIPPSVMIAFVEERLESQHMTPDEARLICDYAVMSAKETCARDLIGV